MPPKKNKTNNYEQFFSPRVTRHASRRAAANVLTATSNSITAEKVHVKCHAFQYLVGIYIKECYSSYLEQKIQLRAGIHDSKQMLKQK